MKLSGYTSQVSSSTVSTPTMSVVTDANAYGDGGKSLMALSNAFGAWADAIKKRQDEEDQQTAFDAINAYNEQTYNMMYNGDSALMNQKGSAASNPEYSVGQAFISGEKDIRSSILDGVKFHNKKNMLALQQTFDRQALTNMKTVGNYEQQQIMLARKTTLDNGARTANAMAQKNYGNAEAMANGADYLNLMINSNFPNIGDEQREAMRNQYLGGFYGSAIQAAITANDTNAYNDLMTAGRQYLTAQQIEAFQKSQQNFAMDEFVRSSAQKAYAAGMTREQYAAQLKTERFISGGKVEEQKEGTSWVKNHDGVNMNLKGNALQGFYAFAKLYNEMSGGDKLIVTDGLSGNSIHADGTRSHAAGVKIDTDTAWLRNSDNRHNLLAAARRLGIVINDEYEKPSANSTGGHLDIDFSDFNSSAERGLSLKEQDSCLAQYDRLKSQARQQKTIADMEFTMEVQDDVEDMLTKGNVTIEGLREYIKNKCGADTKRIRKAEGIIKSLYGIYGENTLAGGGVSGAYGSGGLGSGGVGGLKLWGAGKGFIDQSALDDEYKRGNIPDEDTLLRIVHSLGGNAQQYKTARDRWRKWYKREGEFNYDFDKYKKDMLGSVQLKGAASIYWEGAKNYAVDKLNEYTIRYHKEPPPGMVQQWIVDALKEKKYVGTVRTMIGGNLPTPIGDSLEFTEAQIRNAGIKKWRAGETTVSIVDNNNEMSVIPLEEFANRVRNNEIWGSKYGG